MSRRRFYRGPMNPKQGMPLLRKYSLRRCYPTARSCACSSSRSGRSSTKPTSLARMIARRTLNSRAAMQTLSFRRSRRSSRWGTRAIDCRLQGANPYTKSGAQTVWKRRINKCMQIDDESTYLPMEDDNPDLLKFLEQVYPEV